MRYSGFFLSIIGFLSAHAQQSEIDSLEKIIPNTPDDKKIEVYQAIITKLWLNQPDTAMRYAQAAVQFTKDRTAGEKAIAFRMKGAVFFYKDQYDSCIKYNYLALAYSEDSRDSILIANSMNNLGLAFMEIGSYPSALEYLLKSLLLKNKFKTTIGLSRTQNNVGLVYNELKQYNKAREFFKLALDVAKSKNYIDGQIYSLNNIGLAYLDEGKPTEAHPFFNEAEQVARATNNSVDESTTYCGLGRVAMEAGLFVEAKDYLHRSLKIRKRLNETAGMAEVYFYLGTLFKKAGATDSTLFYFRLSQKLAASSHSPDIQIMSYQAIASLFQHLNNYDSAYFYQSKFIALRDSLFNESMLRSMNNVQLQMKDQEASIKLQEKDREISFRKMIAYFIGAFALVIMLAAVGFYRSRNRERKLKEVLWQKNDEIEQQKEELLLNNEQLANAHEIISKQNTELEEFNRQLQTAVVSRTQELELANRELNLVNLELDNFIYRSSHDIKGPLVRLIGLCHVALLDVADTKARDYLSMLNEAAQNLSDIFDRLRTVSYINSISLSSEKIEFNEIIEKVKDKLKSLDGFHEISFNENIERMEFKSDPTVIETIFYNMMENAVKFQKKSAEFIKFVAITIKRENGSVHVNFMDNGIGIRTANENEIFNMFNRAALEHKNIGLGLYIVKQCAARLNGTIRIVPNSQRYTEFELSLPFRSSN
ncbi:MAG: tetratricopeptide repeat-containing sensor histidine kinase [Bacteroidetes bacterium]|nr:tetratricopeptide repeat-containing sensor histidine kinase [Bacteroidota bacterium]